jgi:antitoxin (DNA-binding transcriptional repressor) of toxin-antitoxin stability system
MYNLNIQKHEGRKRIMSITATELKNNLGKYLLLAATEDIFITRNGKVVAKLSNPYQDRVDIAKSLFGILPDDVTLEEAKEERLNLI